MKEKRSFYKKFGFWKITFLILASLVIFSEVAPIIQNRLSRNDMTKQRLAVVKQVSASEIYPEFTCPCCDQPLDKDNPCCGSMTQMIDFIDRQVELNSSESEVYLATAKEFGIDRLTREEKREEMREILLSLAPKDSPRIIIEDDFQNLGNISASQGEVKVEFELKNKGKSDLVINKLSSSCGCTSGSIFYNGQEGPRFTMEGHGKENPTDWQVSVASGDSAVLRVYYDPNFHGDMTGPVTRTVSVFSNDPVDFEKQVTITFDQIP